MTDDIILSNISSLTLKNFTGCFTIAIDTAQQSQYHLYQKGGEVIAATLYGHAIIMISTYLIFPPNPDKVALPTDLIMGFRIAAVFTIGTFWGVLGIIFGLLWDKFKLHETNKVT